jgi:DNA invertase Pin-like site-specific DNA recombinase
MNIGDIFALSGMRSSRLRPPNSRNATSENVRTLRISDTAKSRVAADLHETRRSLSAGVDERADRRQSERELRQVAERAGWEIVEVYRDHGVSGAKGRDKRPRFDALHKAAARREFDVVMAWSVDRLGRTCRTWSAFCPSSTPPASKQVRKAGG